MSNDPFIVTPEDLDTGFQDLRGHPIHTFNVVVKEGVRSIGFDSIFAATGKVIVRDDLFEGTNQVPCSLKVGNGPQIAASFFQTSNFAYGSNYNIDLTAVVFSPDFIFGERVHYTTWRLRSLWRTRGILSGQIVVGDGVGRVIQGLASILVQVDGRYYFTADRNVGDKPFITYYQIEVGFGGRQNGIDTFTELGASSSWPAWTQPIADDPRY